uniref:Uncharacterized protein n=1 Tax=Globodera rostochiensis TaxID=31243 RepID=A0A914HZX0_GLORO
MAVNKMLKAAAYLIMFAFSAAVGPSPKVTTIQMSTEEGFRIYEHWTTQAFASLLSAFLQEKHTTKQMDAVPDQFTECYFGAQTVPLMAKCIVRLLNKEFEIELQNVNDAAAVSIIKKAAKSSRLQIYGAKKQKWVGQLRMDNENDNRQSMKEEGQNVRRTFGPNKKFYYYAMPKDELKVRKREAIFAEHRQLFKKTDQQHSATEERHKIAILKSRKTYNLLEAKRTFGLSPIGGLARLLMSGVLGRKNKTQTIPWQESITKIQEAKKADNQLRRDEKQWQDFAMRRMPIKSTDLHKKYRKKALKVNSVDDTRGYGSKVKKLDDQIAQLVNDGIKLGMRLTQNNNSTSAVDDTNKLEEQIEDEHEENVVYGSDENDGYGNSVRRDENDGYDNNVRRAAGGGRLMDILSPRFMSVTERKSRGKANFLSPSLFSLHNKGTWLERKLSLPNLMKDGAPQQFTGRDQNEWLNLIMEASGVNEQAETIKKMLSTDGYRQKDVAKKVENRFKREFNGLYLTKENMHELYGRHEQRKADIWEKLVNNFSTQQWNEINRTGIVSMNAKQLHMFYGPTSPDRIDRIRHTQAV